MATTKTQPTSTKRYNVRDLSEKVGSDPRETRKLLRVLAAENDSPELRVNEDAQGRYSWNSRQFQKVTKLVGRALKTAASKSA